MGNVTVPKGLMAADLAKALVRIVTVSFLDCLEGFLADVLVIDVASANFFDGILAVMGFLVTDFWAARLTGATNLADTLTF